MNNAQTFSALLFLSAGLTACGDLESDFEFETSESALRYSVVTERGATFAVRSDERRAGSSDLTADPDTAGVYTCCDEHNNCYDIELDETCAPGETLLWCMGDGLCEPGKKSD